MFRFTRRGVLQAATAVVAMPAIGRAQAGSLTLGVLTPLTGAGSFDGPRMLKAMQAVASDINAAGGLHGPQDRTGGRGRRDQSGSRGARGAQAGRCEQGAGDHGDVGLGGHHRGRAGVLGEQDVPDHGVRCGLDHASAASGLSDPHAAEQPVAGDEACGVHHQEQAPSGCSSWRSRHRSPSRRGST